MTPEQIDNMQAGRGLDELVAQRVMLAQDGGTLSETWTTEYPTKPGYYWLKNYHLSDWRDSWLVSGPVIVCVMPNHRNAPEFRLVFDFTGDDRGYGERDIVSAEWFGPIQPPQ